MLFRFALYGFLKNQRYFEPFLVLALLEKGLSFFTIGVLIGYREVAVNLLEIPSGAIADVWGRRRSMILAFAAYTGSFVVFGQADALGLLFVAMSLFAVGEAFRSGTHKAMIFTWLESQGRQGERTKVYGYTRSWSKFGSAASVVLATALVYSSSSYTLVFYISAIPCLLNIVNFVGYPRDLESETTPGSASRRIIRHLRDVLATFVARPGLRRLTFESMGFDGVFHAIKDYLQPLLMTATIAGATAATATATATALANDPADIRQTALLVGPVYLALYLLSGVASRYAHRVADAAGSEDRAAQRLWSSALAIFVAMAIAAYLDLVWIVAVAFIAVHVLQNLWRPVLLGRLDSQSEARHGATVLSIESQGHRLATMVLAPALGLAVDAVLAHGPGGAFWPIGVAGALAAVLGLYASKVSDTSSR